MIDVLISSIGLCGAWLLLAGSIYQAAIELRAHELAVDRLEAVGAAARTQQVSAWWWLLPPVKVYLERRRAMAQRPVYMSALSVDEFDRLVSYINKATGWLLVGLGGFMIATNETHQFCREHQVGEILFVLIDVTLASLCVAFMRVRTASSDKLLAQKRAGATGASPGISPGT